MNRKPAGQLLKDLGFTRSRARINHAELVTEELLTASQASDLVGRFLARETSHRQPIPSDPEQAKEI